MLSPASPARARVCVCCRIVNEYYPCECTCTYLSLPHRLFTSSLNSHGKDLRCCQPAAKGTAAALGYHSESHPPHFGHPEPDPGHVVRWESTFRGVPFNVCFPFFVTRSNALQPECNPPRSCKQKMIAKRNCSASVRPVIS